MHQQYVDHAEILYLVNELEELVEPEDGIEEEAEEDASVCPVDALVDADVHESVVENGATNDHDALDRERLRSHSVLAEVLLELLVHRQTHLLQDSVVDAGLIQILQSVGILLGENALLKIW